MKNIPFSPPDITELEIAAVADVLRSGWITSGPSTKAFEEELSTASNTTKTVCLSSATAALELTLRALGVGPGDEVITTAYTYTASASVIDHVGAKIVMVDTDPGTFDMSLEQVEKSITSKTKAIIAVDLAGVIYDHDSLIRLAESRTSEFRPSHPLQESIGRIAVIADGAHSFGAVANGRQSGSIADFTCFSFHAVKNLTTAEGGAVTWRADLPVDHETLYTSIRRNSLHGQTKDALAKTNAAAWEYDIVEPGYKCNMTDIQAAIGRVQLSRYSDMVDHRHSVVDVYDEILGDKATPRAHRGQSWRSSAHLYMVSLTGCTSADRDRLITDLAEKGVNTNVHYKPLPLLTAYRNLGFDSGDYPSAISAFENEVTLPLYSILSLDDAAYVAESVVSWLSAKGL